MDEAQAVAKQSADEAQRICEEIRRISGGESITFGELVRDERVEQTFEALMGTLKAARKRLGGHLIVGLCRHVVSFCII